MKMPGLTSSTLPPIPDDTIDKNKLRLPVYEELDDLLLMLIILRRRKCINERMKTKKKKRRSSIQQTRDAPKKKRKKGSFRTFGKEIYFWRKQILYR